MPGSTFSISATRASRTGNSTMGRFSFTCVMASAAPQAGLRYRRHSASSLSPTAHDSIPSSKATWCARHCRWRPFRTPRCSSATTA
jgi:hypothetical protein